MPSLRNRGRVSSDWGNTWSTWALDILHVNADGTDQPEACQESCYECLRSFYNQWHHEKMDRSLVIPLLRAIAQDVDITVTAGTTEWDDMMTSFDSATEEHMVQRLREASIPAPTQAHVGLPPQ